MSENITLTITEKHVTFDPIVQVKTIEPRKDISRVLKPTPIKRPIVRPRIGLQFVR